MLSSLPLLRPPMLWDPVPGTTHWGSSPNSGQQVSAGAAGGGGGNDTLIGATVPQQQPGQQNRGEGANGAAVGITTRSGNVMPSMFDDGPVGSLHLLTNSWYQVRETEAFIAQRRLNIQRWGATWLRPPGISRTYQAALDEAAEREEQQRLLEQAQEETSALEEQQQQQQGDITGLGVEGDTTADGTPGGGVAGAGQGGQEDDFERDLDDEIPEAMSDDDFPDDGDNSDGYNEFDAAEYFMNGEDEEDDEEDDGVLVSPVREGDEEDDAIRDLDEDVPEAGSYQHTDTEYDEISDEVGGDSTMSQAEAGGRVVGSGAGRIGEGVAGGGAGGGGGSAGGRQARRL